MICKQDCFEAKKTEIDCKQALGGSCYITKTENQAVCIDENWEQFEFQLKKIRQAGESLEELPAPSIEVFINQTGVDASSFTGLKSDKEGKFSETLPPGENTFQVKYPLYKNIAVLSRALIRKESVIENFHGRYTKFEDETRPAPSQSLYITGSIKLFDDWKAYKLKAKTTGLMKIS